MPTSCMTAGLMSPLLSKIIKIPEWLLLLPLLSLSPATCAFLFTLSWVLGLSHPLRSRLQSLWALTCCSELTTIAGSHIGSFPCIENTACSPSLGSLGSCSVFIRVWYCSHSSLELSMDVFITSHTTHVAFRVVW